MYATIFTWTRSGLPNRRALSRFLRKASSRKLQQDKRNNGKSYYKTYVYQRGVMPGTVHVPHAYIHVRIIRRALTIISYPFKLQLHYTSSKPLNVERAHFRILLKGKQIKVQANKGGGILNMVKTIARRKHRLAP